MPGIFPQIFISATELTMQFRARAAPSAGLLTTFHSYLCNMQNECHNIEEFEVNIIKMTLKALKFYFKNSNIMLDCDMKGF